MERVAILNALRVDIVNRIRLLIPCPGCELHFTVCLSDRCGNTAKDINTDFLFDIENGTDCTPISPARDHRLDFGEIVHLEEF